MNLTEKAMLVRQAIKTWSGRMYDRAASEDIAQRNNALVDAGRYNKVLVDPAALAPITKIVSEARKHHYTNTLPWEDWGARLLPASRYFDYVQEQNRLQGLFEQEVRRFAADFPQHMAAAQSKLGGLFDPDDYPNAADIEGRFAFGFTFLPLPNEADFRVNLGTEEEKRVRSEIESSVQQMVNRATRNIWDRAYEAVSNMYERLADSDGRFKNSLVGNIRELVALMPSLNITDDPELERIRREMEARLCKYEPQSLREDPTIRADVARDAADILADMGAFMGQTNAA